MNIEQGRAGMGMKYLLRTEMNALIDSYLAQHPDFKYPERSRHPAVLALTVDMNAWLVDECGGIGSFWSLMVDSAKSWFDPSEESLELKYFHARLSASCAMMGQALPHVSSIDDFYWQQGQLLERAWQDYVDWKKRGAQI
jgi:hypothetical protein